MLRSPARSAVPPCLRRTYPGSAWRRLPLGASLFCTKFTHGLFGMHCRGRRTWQNGRMSGRMSNPGAITIRLAEPRDAQAIALMSRDFIESGLGWKYDAPRVLRAIRDPDTLAAVACEGAKGGAKGAITGFAIMEFGDERAHLVLLAVRPSQRRQGIGQRLLEWLLESARTAGMASVHLEL